jgi:hypothetical protein
MMIAGRSAILGYIGYFILISVLILNDSRVLAKKKTDSPSLSPSTSPSNTPTNTPTKPPTRKPTKPPTRPPTTSPSQSPTGDPSSSPTISFSPTASPTATASNIPTFLPSPSPSYRPSPTPTATHTIGPSNILNEAAIITINNNLNPLTRTPSVNPTRPPPTLSPTDAPTLSLSDLVDQKNQNPDNGPPEEKSPDDYKDDSSNNEKPQDVVSSPPDSAEDDTSITERPTDLFSPPGPVETTSINGIGNGDVGVLMPYITFDITISGDEDAPIPATEETASFFADFLNDVLDSSSGTYQYDYSHLDCDVMISTFNQRRRLDTGYVIRVDGMAYYFDESPTEESIAQTLNIYFAFWGATDLQDYFTYLGLETAVVTAIYIDDVAVSFVSNEYDGESTIKEDQNFIEDVFYNNEGELSKPVTVTVYVMVVLIAVGIALIVYRIRIGRRRRRSQNVDTQSFETSNTDGDEEKISLSDATAKHMNTSVPEKSYGKVKPDREKCLPISPDCTQTSILNQQSHTTQEIVSDQIESVDQNPAPDTDIDNSAGSCDSDQQSQIQENIVCKTNTCSVDRNPEPDMDNTKESVLIQTNDVYDVDRSINPNSTETRSLDPTSNTQESVLNQINNNDSKSDMDSSIKLDSSNVKRLDPPSQI